MSYARSLRCRKCEHEYRLDPMNMCEFCLSPLEVIYDYKSMSSVVSRESIEKGPRSLWRYRDLLPAEGEVVDIGSGWTPLTKAENLGQVLGLDHLYIKNDCLNPTYSFKDYAARFFARVLNYFLKRSGLKRMVAVATSGDTGGAVADALHNQDSVDNVIFFPKGSITERQRRQMTTLQDNIYAFEVNGDFDVCQALAKRLLGDRNFADQLFGDPDRFTSANSISLGRLLPQAVYSFFAYSRVAHYDEPMIASVPSGNFGDMMGTVLAKEMGLPIPKIVCGVNENREFPEFLSTGSYVVKPSIKSPSSAMIVSNPSNFARLIDLYG